MRRFLIIELFLTFLTYSCQIGKNNGISFPEGGYRYPEKIEEKDKLQFIYPIKDSISRIDSFNYSTYSEFLYKSFNEPNLSILPPKEPIFRLVFQPGFSRYVAILTLQENKIIVKELETGYALPYTEIDRLNSLEQEHFSLFKRFFPINDYIVNLRGKKYLDSMTKFYPQLLDVKYYRSLINKSNSFGVETFTYKKREITITNEKFRQLVNQINASGYWKMKPIEFNCVGEVDHPNEFSLEAATKYKYNFVSYMECKDDTSKFDQVCHALSKISKIDDEMNRWHVKTIRDINKK